MKNFYSIVLTLFASAPLMAEQARNLDAHEHGVGELNIAFADQTVLIEFHAPGADIVGFEYKANSSEDRAAIDNAVATLAKPLELFVLPDAAQCSVVQASTELASEAGHEKHADTAHGHDNDGHAHSDKEHDAHAHDEHGDGEHGHSEHGHNDHAHDDHGHSEHADAETHTEFHALYTLECADPSAIDQIRFAYFDKFANARELEIQIVSKAGAQRFEADRTSPVLNLRGLF